MGSPSITYQAINRLQHLSFPSDGPLVYGADRNRHNAFQSRQFWRRLRSRACLRPGHRRHRRIRGDADERYLRPRTLEAQRLLPASLHVDERGILVSNSCLGLGHHRTVKNLLLRLGKHKQARQLRNSPRRALPYSSRLSTPPACLATTVPMAPSQFLTWGSAAVTRLGSWRSLPTRKAGEIFATWDLP